MIDKTSETEFFDKAISFLSEIGIETVYENIQDEDCFLPGFSIAKGKIIIDTNKVKSPGDVLHEAAHIAVVSSIERDELGGKDIGKRKDAAAEEMMAIAWSYAACLHLGIDPHFVFHENGYKGGGDNIVDNFKSGNYVGVPLLQWLGMATTLPGEGNVFTYPMMMKWLRD
jgi:hypothetical protein